MPSGRPALRGPSPSPHGRTTELQEHLFRVSFREGAAFLLVGMATTRRGARSLVREVIPVAHQDFVAGEGSYRLSSRAVAQSGAPCPRGGALSLVGPLPPGRHLEGCFQSPGPPHDRAGASDDDGHRRGAGRRLGVRHAMRSKVNCGSAKVTRTSLRSVRIRGAERSRPHRNPCQSGLGSFGRHARQMLLFGHDGQARLRGLRVAVIGVGGGGSIIVEQLARDRRWRRSFWSIQTSCRPAICRGSWDLGVLMRV